MKITYRPHRGGYEESMKLCREYNSIIDMLISICQDYDYAFDIEDISIRYYIHDVRNGWDTFAVETRVIGEKKFNTPALVGWCKFN